MDNVFVLNYNHGEYDDYLSIPIGVTQDLASAQLIQESLESKKPEFMFLLEDMTSDEFTIDILELPVLYI